MIEIFNLTFELAWKSLKEILKLYGVDVSKSGSPREILKTGYSMGFVSNSEIWLDMMLNRNFSVHVYDESLAVDLVESIFSKYIPAFVELKDILTEKLNSIQ